MVEPHFSHDPLALSLYSLFTIALVLRCQALCLPFTLAWSIAYEPCLPFIILPYKITLYHASSIYSLSHFDH